MTIVRAWELARLGIAILVFLGAGTMVVLRIHDEARRSRELPEPVAEPAPTPDPRASDSSAQCAAGMASVCLDLGLEWLAYGTAEGETYARTAFERACEAGEPQGCHNLARMLAEGSGGARDRGAALKAYTEACRDGLPWSCYGGALLVAQDDMPRAAAMLEQACDGSYAAACYELALLVDSGAGTEKDPRRARDLLATACQAGEGRACEVLRATQEMDARAATSSRK